MLLRWKTSNLIFDSIPAKLFDQFFHSFVLQIKCCVSHPRFLNIQQLFFEIEVNSG